MARCHCRLVKYSLYLIIAESSLIAPGNWLVPNENVTFQNLYWQARSRGEQFSYGPPTPA